VKLEKIFVMTLGLFAFSIAFLITTPAQAAINPANDIEVNAGFTIATRDSRGATYNTNNVRLLFKRNDSNSFGDGAFFIKDIGNETLGVSFYKNIKDQPNTCMLNFGNVHEIPDPGTRPAPDFFSCTATIDGVAENVSGGRCDGKFRSERRRQFYIPCAKNLRFVVRFKGYYRISEWPSNNGYTYGEEIGDFIFSVQLN